MLRAGFVLIVQDDHTKKKKKHINPAQCRLKLGGLWDLITNLGFASLIICTMGIEIKEIDNGNYSLIIWTMGIEIKVFNREKGKFEADDNCCSSGPNVSTRDEVRCADPVNYELRVETVKTGYTQGQEGELKCGLAPKWALRNKL
jgi:hypothetical protein